MHIGEAEIRKTIVNYSIKKHIIRLRRIVFIYSLCSCVFLALRIMDTSSVLSSLVGLASR